jgi:hypothetical protein
MPIKLLPFGQGDDQVRKAHAAVGGPHCRGRFRVQARRLEKFQTPGSSDKVDKIFAQKAASLSRHSLAPVHNPKLHWQNAHLKLITNQVPSSNCSSQLQILSGSKVFQMFFPVHRNN